jgi:uncharacterized repeat protein (TIGR02543 family)
MSDLLLHFSRGVKMKKRFLYATTIAILIVILSLGLAACNKGSDGRVPVYQGMSISQDLRMATKPMFAAGSGNQHGHNPGEHYGDYEGRNEDLDQDLPFEDDNLPTIEEKTESTLNVVGSADKIYYADKNQDIYIKIRLSNPDSYEIMSFTLNGNKYSSYMFEQGSDMENLILKLNVGNAAGIVDYTIDAIKYIDGTDIKDVIMDGDKTVKAGIRASDQTYANVSGEQISLTEINFNANIVDLYSLIEKSGGYAKTALYDGTNIIYKDIEVGQQVEVSFDSLTPNTLYQYGIVALYDDLSGGGAKLNILYKKAVYTNTIVLFDNITVDKTFASWDYNWDSGASDKTITALSLWQDGYKIKDLSTSAKTVDNLFTANEYTIKAQYNNLKGDSEEIQLSFTTLANVVPAMGIKNASTTQTSVSFGIEITDSDSVGSLTKIELLHEGDNPIVASGTEIREFTDLLSNNDYTIKATYTYDLNDGEGEHTIVKTADVQTLAKATPTVSIIYVESAQTSISFDIDITDSDSVGNLTKIELLHGSDTPIVASGTEIREFTGLLSNNAYTVRATYTYDLNDGEGEHTIVKTADVQTLAKATPTVSIIDVDSTQTSISFGIEITDSDSVGELTKIELLHGSDTPIVASGTEIREFTGLLSNNAYTVRATYTYDLNDGEGNREKYATCELWTAPIFEFVKATCANTGPVSEGDTIYFEAIVNNPNKVVVSKVKLNGEYYNVSSGTTQNSIIVNILVANQFEGGNTELTITEIVGTLNGVKRSIVIDDDTHATASAFVNGQLTVKSITILDEYFEEPQLLVAGGTYYYYIKLGNKTGYSIDKITVSGTTYTKGDTRLTQTDDETILIATTYGVGWRSNTLTSIEYSNDSLGIRTREFDESTASFLCLESISPIVIANADDLKNMSGYGYYILESDIDLAGAEWKNPGSFYGYFDGQGHIIKNMNFVNTVENNELYWGLFHSATGYMKNLRLSGRLITTITSTTSDSYRVYAGGLAAKTNERLIIDKVASNVTLAVTQQTSGDTYIGGLIGYVDSSAKAIIVKNSYSTGNISANRGNAGGLIGYKYYYWNGGDIAECQNSYFISSTASESYGAIRKNSIEEITAILQPTWGDVVWDFDELDSSGNPIYKERYNISYELNGGTNSRQNPVQYTSHSANTVIHEPVRVGYTFDGWYNNADFEGLSIDAIAAGECGNKVLYAKWQKIATVISFDSNGGIESFGTIVLTTEDAVSLPIPTHTDKTLTFVGWYTDKDAGERITFGNGEGLESWACDDSEITLYARWYSYHRVNASNEPTTDGQYILFGEYPQSLVSDNGLAEELATQAGILPTATNSGSWLSYDYYISGSNSTDFMWYIDIQHNGNKYRGVYFVSYRPYYTYNDSNTYQDDNGYYIQNIYWFEYQPIKWRILKEENGKALLVAELILDSQDYNYTSSSSSINGYNTYANNYAYSSIRGWLNSEFYNTAFNELEKALISLTMVDNGLPTTGYDVNPYICQDTQDNIFLLSYADATNSEYFTSDTSRQKRTSDYAQSQGAYTSSGTGWWWLRSPDNNDRDDARDIRSNGYADGSSNVNSTRHGVVPALVISLP